MKTSAEPIPVVVVGGGSILLGDSLPGASELVKPRALRGRERDRRSDRAGRRRGRQGLRARADDQRDAALDEAKAEAIDKAVAAGASPRHRPDRRRRGGPDRVSARQRHADPRQGGRRSRAAGGRRCGSIGEAELEDIAVGAAILGTGGGGDPYIGKLLAQEAIRRYGPVQMVSVDEVPDDAFVVPSAMMGAPTVMVEKLPARRRGDSCLRGAWGLRWTRADAHDLDRGGRAELDDTVRRGRTARDPARRRRRDGPRLSGDPDDHRDDVRREGDTDDAR